MAYPRDSLAPGEVVVVHRHPHWKSLVVPFLFFVLATGLAGLCSGLVSGATDGALETWGTVAIVVLWAAALVWWFVRPLLGWLTTHFVVTDRRVMHRQGVVKRIGVDLPTSRIHNVEFRNGVVDRMLGTGTLHIVSSTEAPLTFRGVPRVAAVHGLLYEQVLDDSHREFDEMSWR